MIIIWPIQAEPGHVDIATTGRGNRERKNVVYADLLTEEEFLNAVDDGLFPH